MGFWDTLWATMWGALAGAVVGAAASWGFALHLRKGERQVRAREVVTRHLGELIESLTILQAGLGVPGRHSRKMVAREREATYAVLSRLRAASIVAEDSQRGVLVAAIAAVRQFPRGHEGAVQASFVAMLLLEWARGGVPDPVAGAQLYALASGQHFNDDGEPGLRGVDAAFGWATPGNLPDSDDSEP